MKYTNNSKILNKSFCESFSNYVQGKFNRSYTEFVFSDKPNEYYDKLQSIADNWGESSKVNYDETFDMHWRNRALIENIVEVIDTDYGLVYTLYINSPLVYVFVNDFELSSNEWLGYLFNNDGKIQFDFSRYNY